MDDISEFASLEAQAFSGAICYEYFEQPLECVIRRGKNGESIEGYVDGKSSLSDGGKNEWKMYEISCKLCGLAVPLDVLETNNPEFDTNKNVIRREVLSKSGAQRRRQEALATMDDIALSLNYDNQMILEANKIFEALHLTGGTTGGRGFKTVAVASLWLASQNAGKPIPVKLLCESHPERPQAKVVKRLVKDAKRNGNIPNIKHFNASERLEIIGQQMLADPQIVEFAKKYASMQIPLLPSDAQAAAALYIAAGLDGKRKAQYSAAAIQRKTGINRKRIYNAVKLMQPKAKKNPPKERVTTMPATAINELRRIRKY